MAKVLLLTGGKRYPPALDLEAGSGGNDHMLAPGQALKAKLALLTGLEALLFLIANLTRDLSLGHRLPVLVHYMAGDGAQTFKLADNAEWRHLVLLATPPGMAIGFAREAHRQQRIKSG